MSAATEVIRLNLAVDTRKASPLELRTRFAAATREAIQRAARTGRVRLEHAEELWRAVRDPGAA